MALNRTTIAYLDAMGVTAWQRRRPAAERSRPAAPALECVQHADPMLASVVVQWRGPFALSADHPGGKLLGKILAALKRSPAEFAVYRIEPGVRSPCPNPPGRVVLAFAERSPAAGAEGPEVVRLPTLEAMLADPGAKRFAWAALRPWVDRLKG